MSLFSGVWMTLAARATATIESIEDILGVNVRKPPLFYLNKSQPLEVKLGFYLESLGNFRSTEMVGSSQSRQPQAGVFPPDKTCVLRILVPGR